MTPSLPIERLQGYIEKLTFGDLLALYSNGQTRLFEGMTIHGLILGNLNMQDAVKLLEPIRDLRSSTSCVSNVHDEETSVLDLSTIPVEEGKPKWFRATCASKKPDDPSSAAFMTCQVQIDNHNASSSF